MTNILVCGDSFCNTDPGYPNLHWTEKIPSEYKIYNLSFGGCSNALIALQLLQGLELNPDFVIISFTSDSRYEFDKNSTANLTNKTVLDITNYQKSRYTTNMYAPESADTKSHLHRLNQWLHLSASENFEKLKNYFYITMCLTLLDSLNIPFCYSLGGFEQTYKNTIDHNYINDVLNKYQKNKLSINLWDYNSSNLRPYFHVNDDRAQTMFATECISKLIGHKQKYE